MMNYSSGAVGSNRTLVRQMTSSEFRKPLLENVRIAFAAGMSNMMQMFCAQPQLKNSMCKNYGHTIDAKSWNRGLPKCEDCGAKINGPADLRKASCR